MRNIRTGLILALAGIFIAGCVPSATTSNHRGNSGISKSLIGTLLGAAGGGYVGSQFGGGTGKLVFTSVGVLAGAYMGNQVGASLDRADRLAMQEAQYRALEHNRSGESETWRNPDYRAQTYGRTVPLRTFEDRSSGQRRYCREYQTDVTINGKTKRAYGTACRQPDGSWEVVNNSR